ncbi:hypothetical protein SAMN02745911_1204 [Aureimonas altamirensis DSM 21988]|uniref:DUF2213 domain-containing protein n=2 Tax=Aureimonas altamirensis TaxID=370622 RepID=A0A0P0YX51_9HYPH|nr:DUF2213 domain-containing protein [Aureimonas altamirensis]BAT26059.1 hypothetical protein [Aureimonas altamirensis]SHI79938.1 hypothetical protein SAMN02745911_1204 [Aureimonas altamirensis DSM 21988]
MNFIDAAAVEHPRVTSDGYLVADARVVRTGIQIYTGAEVGKPELAMVRVYRPGAEVFSSDSLASFSHIPVTDDHPSVAVSAANWKDLAVGETSGEVLRDGHRLRIPLIVKDAAAVSKVQAGKRELSAGYTCDLAFESGTTPDGEAYDAIQRNIRANHLAIVQRGRAGTECRIGDDAGGPWGIAPITDNAPKEGLMADLRKVMVDGLQVETTDAGAAAIDKLQKDKQAIEAKLSDAQVSNDKAIATKDTDLAKKDAEIDSLKAKILSDADLDKRVQQRADLITTAKTIVGDNFEHAGKSDAEIRRAVVVAKLGDAAVKDKAEAYIDARFDILAEDGVKNIDGLRNAVRDAKPAPNLTADEANAYAASLADLNRKPEAA